MEPENPINTSISIEPLSNPVNKSKKYLLIIIIGTVTLLTIGGGFLYLGIHDTQPNNEIPPTIQSNQNNFPTTYIVYPTKDPHIVTARNTPTDIPLSLSPKIALKTSSPSPDPAISSWLTLDNVNGFSIKYPTTRIIYPEQYQERPNTTTANGISVQQKEDGFNKPLLIIYVFSPTDTSYTFSTLKELADQNYHENSSNKNTFIRLVEGLHQTTFSGEQSYQYTIESKGFQGAWTGFVGEQGVIKIVIFHHNNKYWLIGYYIIPEFEKILSTFKFTI